MGLSGGVLSEETCMRGGEECSRPGNIMSKVLFVRKPPQVFQEKQGDQCAGELPGNQGESGRK